MNDLRSPSEDRPYRPAAQSPRLTQDDVDPEYGMTLFERIRYSRWFPLASVFAAVLIFSGIVSYAYKQGSQTGVNATTPVVMADSKDYKEKPANPGGMDVPFQDAVVFDQLQNKDQAANADGKTESLLPPPEQAVANTPAAATPAAPAPAATPAPAPETAPVAAASETPAVPAPAAPAPVAVKETPDAPAVAPAPAAPETAASVATATATAPEATEEEPATAPAPVEKHVAAPVKKAPVKKTVAAAPAPKAVASSAKVEGGAYRIQLGAFRDEAAARSAWAKVKGQYAALSSVAPAFPRADLGAKGIFYRAQGTNLSKASADSLCHTINAGKAGSCIVTH